MKHAVVIAGGGPTGLMLAAELALAKIDVALVERRVDQTVAGTRAGGLHARTLEVLDQRGVVERFLAEGKVMQVNGFAMNHFDISDLPTRHAYGLALPQEKIEALLAAWVAELGVAQYRGVDVVDVAQNDGVDITLSDGRVLRAQYLVGCDGGRSIVRKRAGIDFVGWDASVSYVIAEFLVTEQPPIGVRLGERGVNGIGPIGDSKRMRAVLVEPEVRHGDTPTIDELRSALIAVYSTDFGAHDVTWISRFSDAARLAETYRAGRILVAGDAAHVHSPTGGQGLNTGVQDAVNLGWKLAQVVRGTSGESLLDSYHAERHPVGARVLELNLAQTALMRGDDRTRAANNHVGEMLKVREVRHRYGAMMSQLDIAYDLGTTASNSDSSDSGSVRPHALVGRRMPDLDIAIADGPSRASTRVYALMHDARPLLLDFSGEGPLLAAMQPWMNRVLRVAAHYAGAWVLPVIGIVPAPTAVLLRPDGHVAWVSTGSDDGLRDALARWFGAPDGRA
ncbi:MAG TPA: FAD-dependent monooxygenase [Kofleriaceae bacterium]